MENDGAVGAGSVDFWSADDDAAVGNFIETGEHGEDGGFPATGVADESDEFAFLDIQVEIDDGFEWFSERVRVGFG